MRRILTALPLIFALDTAPQLARGQPVIALDGTAFAAIGKLEIGNGTFCTATLIAPRIVLTAAHCVIDAATGTRHDPAGITFLAGLRDGRPEAHRNARRIVVHPDHAPGETGLSDLSVDLALLELDHPIAPDRIAAIPLAREVRRGDAVGVVSYRFDHAHRPALERRCHVLARRSGALITSCEVDFGASGAPILRFGTGRVPRLVSVVSAKAQIGDLNVSIGTALDVPLARLRDMLTDRGSGVTGADPRAIVPDPAPTRVPRSGLE